MIKKPRQKARPVSTATLRDHADARLVIVLLHGPNGGYNTLVRFLRGGGEPAQTGMRLDSPIEDEASARERFESLIQRATSRGWLRRAPQKRLINAFDEIPDPPVASAASNGQ